MLKSNSDSKSLAYKITYVFGTIFIMVATLLSVLVLSGCDKKNVSKKDDTHKVATDNGTFKATLSNGVAVELVSVCHFLYKNRKQEKSCWNPDGTKSKLSIYPHVYNTRDAKKHIGFVFRSSKRIETGFWNFDNLPFGNQFRRNYIAFNEKGRKLGDGNYFTYSGPFNEQYLGEIKFHVPLYNWESIAEFDGKYYIGKVDNRIKFIESYDSAGGVKVTFESDIDGFEKRVVAEYIDYGQKQQQITRRMNGSTKMAIDADGKKVSVAIFSGLKLENIKVFRFEIRPKEYEWVVFEKIQLKPSFDYTSDLDE